MDIGVQTFTIRKAQKKNIEKAYLPLINLGIKSFEVARIDFTEDNANELKGLVERYGIEISSIQVKPKYVFGAADAIISFCKKVGCKRVVISMLPFSVILGNENKFYNFISTLDSWYDLYAKSGITLAYHHHNWEYVRLSNGKTRMDELLSKTERIRIVHDTYWTARCGIDPALEIERFSSRTLGVHLRDLTHSAKGLDVIAKNCPVGDGVIDFNRVIKAAESVGAEYLVIEEKTDTPYESIRKSYLHCKAITKE
jgi:sugar phosphate isomerase/epimerase